MTIWKLSLSVLILTCLNAVSVEPAVAGEGHLVQFRLASWKTDHLANQQKATEHGNLLKKLGCEVKIHSHGDHHDVAYRCPEWKQLAAESDEAAHRWQDWLKARGFESRHAH